MIGIMGLLPFRVPAGFFVMFEAAALAHPMEGTSYGLFRAGGFVGLQWVWDLGEFGGVAEGERVLGLAASLSAGPTGP